MSTGFGTPPPPAGGGGLGSGRGGGAGGSGGGSKPDRAASPPPPPPPDPGRSWNAGGNGDADGIRDELTRLSDQIRALAATVANQQSVFVDIAGARTAELHASLAQVGTMAAELRGETVRLRELQEAISLHLHDLVLDVVQPELKQQLSQGLPPIVVEAIGPEVRRTLSDVLPQLVAGHVSPEVRQLLSEWLPVMVADTVQPEVRAAIAERLPDLTTAAVQPELRRVLAERLPHLVAETVQPELYRILTDRLPGVVSDSVTPELRDAMLAELPRLVSDTVRPEVRATLDERLPGVVSQVVGPEVRRVLAERLPSLVAETVQPEVRQTLADRLPHLVSETVRPEVRETLDDRLPGVVASVVSPEVRRVLAERLPSLVAETVQPELRLIMVNRLPGIIAEVVSPAVGLLLTERMPGMLAETVTPELSVTLAETESAAAELRQEAAKLRGLREVVAERLPESVMSAIEPQLQDVLAVRFPRLVNEMVEPVVRSVLTEQLPALVAASVQPGIAEALNARVPELVAESVRPELRQVVLSTLEQRLPQVVAEVVRPELRARLSESLPGVINQVVTPEVIALVAARLPSMVGEAVTPDLSVSLAEIEGTAAEMRAETARIRGLREVVSERLPEAVMGAVQAALDETIAPRLPEMLARVVAPAVRDAIALPLPAALDQRLEPALRAALARELPDVVQRAVESEVRLGLADTLPGIVAASGTTAHDAAFAPFADLREDVVRRLPALVEEAVAGPLARFEASAAQLQAEAERLRAMAAEAPVAAAAAAAVSATTTVDAGPELAAALAAVESTAVELRAEAGRLRAARDDIAAGLPQLVEEAVAAAFARQPVAVAAPPAVGTLIDAGRGDAAAPAAAEEEQDDPRLADALVPATEDAAPPPTVEDTGAAATGPGTAADDVPEAVAEDATDAALAAAIDRLAGFRAPSKAAPPGRPATSPVEPPAAVPAATASRATAARAEPPATPTAPAPAGEESESIACALPGGLIGPTLALGVGDAVSRSRLLRRQRRRAGPPAAGLHRRDPFATPLTRRIELFALAQQASANGAKPAPRLEPGAIAAGERDGAEVVLPLGRTGGISLVGPKARDAARALVLAFLAGHGPRTGRAIVVGNLFPTETVFPGLVRARDVGAVLSSIQAEASRRQALLAEAGLPDVAAYRARRPDDPMPQLLVAADEMTTLDAGRLGAVLEDGARLGISAVLVDAPLESVTSVRLQGQAQVASVTPAADPASVLAGARLFTADPSAAGEVVDILAAARAEVEAEPATAPPNQPFEGIQASPALIQVRLLGGYRIDARGREVRAGLRAKARELLAFYLLHPEGTSLEEAADALWPEADPRRGSEWFWTALGNLRSRLRAATENKDLKIIEREGDRYRVEPIFEVDLWRFESGLTVASSNTGGHGWADSLQDAADLYGGELLAGAEWPWADIPREDLRGRAVDVLVSLAATRQVAGDLQGALKALERAVEVDPLAEQLYRRIMRIHAKLARPDEADAAYRTLQAQLGAFDLHPSSESAKLHTELCGTGG